MLELHILIAGRRNPALNVEMIAPGFWEENSSIGRVIKFCRDLKRVDTFKKKKGFSIIKKGFNLCGCKRNTLDILSFYFSIFNN